MVCTENLQLSLQTARIPTTSEKFENGVYTVFKNTSNVFLSMHMLHRRNLITQQSQLILDLRWRETRAEKSRDYCDVIICVDGRPERSTVFKCLRSRLRSLSTRVFELRTATGNELLSIVTRPHTTTFTLLSISPLEMSSMKFWGIMRSYSTRNVLFRLPSAPQKRACLSSLNNFHREERLNTKLFVAYLARGTRL